jgi:hypothetical protein
VFLIKLISITIFFFLFSEEYLLGSREEDRPIPLGSIRYSFLLYPLVLVYLPRRVKVIYYVPIF